MDWLYQTCTIQRTTDLDVMGYVVLYCSRTQTENALKLLCGAVFKNRCGGM